MQASEGQFSLGTLTLVSPPAAEPCERRVVAAVSTEHPRQGRCSGALHPGPQRWQLLGPRGPREAPVSHCCFRGRPWKVQTW